MGKFELPNYTRVPNALIDQYLPELSECDLRVILFILRKTEGFHREKITISLARISAAVGMGRSTVSRACHALCEKGILVVNKNSCDDGSLSSTTYGVNFVDENEDGGVPLVEHGVPLAGIGGVPLAGGYKEERKQEERNNTDPSPTPSFSEKRTPLELASMRWISERFKSAGRKLTSPEKKQFAEWLGECSFSEEEIEFALKQFFLDPYWRDKGYPPRAFQKKCQEYIDRAESHQPSRPAPSGSGVQPESGGAVPSQDGPSCESQGAGGIGAGPEDGDCHPKNTGAPTGLESRDRELETYVGIFLAAGATIGDFEREQIMPIWRTLNLEQKQRCCQDALRHCSQTEPRYLTMISHLRKKPWTRVTGERLLPTPSPALDKNAEALRILKRRHGIL